MSSFVTARQWGIGTSSALDAQNARRTVVSLVVVAFLQEEIFRGLPDGVRFTHFTLVPWLVFGLQNFHQAAISLSRIYKISFIA
jgi:hypothetical protein